MNLLSGYLYSELLIRALRTRMLVVDPRGLFAGSVRIGDGVLGVNTTPKVMRTSKLLHSFGGPETLLFELILDHLLRSRQFLILLLKLIQYLRLVSIVSLHELHEFLPLFGLHNRYLIFKSVYRILLICSDLKFVLILVHSIPLLHLLLVMPMLLIELLQKLLLGRTHLVLHLLVLLPLGLLQV